MKSRKTDGSWLEQMNSVKAISHHNLVITVHESVWMVGREILASVGQPRSQTVSLKVCCSPRLFPTLQGN